MIVEAQSIRNSHACSYHYPFGIHCDFPGHPSYLLNNRIRSLGFPLRCRVFFHLFAGRGPTEEERKAARKKFMRKQLDDIEKKCFRAR